MRRAVDVSQFLPRPVHVEVPPLVIENLVLTTTSPPFKSDVPIIIDLVESFGGTIIAPKVTIKRLTGSNIYVHGGNGYTQTEVEIHETTIDTIRVDGKLKVKYSLESDTLYATKLEVNYNAKAIVKSLLDLYELWTHQCLVQGATVRINRALCMADTTLNATCYLQVNDLTTYCTTITAPSIRVNHGEIHNRSTIKATLGVTFNVLFLEESSIECPNLHCNSTEYYRESSITSREQDSQFVGNRLLMGNNMSMNKVVVKNVKVYGGTLHARKKLRCNELEISGGTVESPNIKTDTLHLDGRFGVTSIINPGRLTVYQNFECM